MPRHPPRLHQTCPSPGGSETSKQLPFSRHQPPLCPTRTHSPGREEDCQRAAALGPHRCNEGRVGWGWVQRKLAGDSGGDKETRGRVDMRGSNLTDCFASRTRNQDFWQETRVGGQACSAPCQQGRWPRLCWGTGRRPVSDPGQCPGQAAAAAALRPAPASRGATPREAALRGGREGAWREESLLWGRGASQRAMAWGAGAGLRARPGAPTTCPGPAAPKGTKEGSHARSRGATPPGSREGTLGHNLPSPCLVRVRSGSRSGWAVAGGTPTPKASPARLTAQPELGTTF